jgi:elongator complex protein 4
MSSFKRKVKVSTTEAPTEQKKESADANTPSVPEEEVQEISGTKPWIHNGQCIVSSGHRQLDDLMGGGIPVGTMNLYTYDEGSTYCQQLHLYNLAESISHNHRTLVIAIDNLEAESILKSIPYNSSIGRSDEKPENESKDANQSSENWGLKIAWQYQKYLG